MTTTVRIDRICRKWKRLVDWFKDYHKPVLKRHQRVRLDNNGHHIRGTYGMVYRLPDEDYGHHCVARFPKRRGGQV